LSSDIIESCWARRLEHQVFVVLVAAAQLVLGDHGPDDAADNERVFTEIVDHLFEFTFEKQVAVLHERGVDRFGSKGGQGLGDRLAAVFAARAGGQAGQHGLRWSHVGHGKLFIAQDVLISVMPRCADEAEVILPAHRYSQVLGREVVAAVRLPRADDDQRKNCEKTLPDGFAGVQLDQVFAIGHAISWLSVSNQR
jgi:hypothetical protein